MPSKCVLKNTTVAGRGNNQVSWAGCHGQAGAAGNLPGEPEWTLNNFKLIKMIIMFAEAFLTGKPFFAMQKKPWLLHFYVPDFVLTHVLRLESSRGDSDLAQNSAMMRYQRERNTKGRVLTLLEEVVFKHFPHIINLHSTWLHHLQCAWPS